jgi:hypothetical protein
LKSSNNPPKHTPAEVPLYHCTHYKANPQDASRLQRVPCSGPYKRGTESLPIKSLFAMSVSTLKTRHRKQKIFCLNNYIIDLFVLAHKGTLDLFLKVSGISGPWKVTNSVLCLNLRWLLKMPCGGQIEMLTRTLRATQKRGHFQTRSARAFPNNLAVVHAPSQTDQRSIK